MRANCVVGFLDPLEDFPTLQGVLRGPKLLENVDGMQSHKPCLFEVISRVRNYSLRLHCTTYDGVVIGLTAAD
jgi:hypothetical protein